MADNLATFNVYNYRTFPLAATITQSAVFTPDSDKVYLVKVLHVTNYTVGNEDITVDFYSGADSTEYPIYVNKPVSAGVRDALLENGGVIVRGDLGDELRVTASADNTMTVLAVAMIMGRDSGN